MTTTAALKDLPSLVGEKLGTSDWLTVSQEMIDQFADATGDHQWIHVDPERAEDSPFGTTVAHGYLTVSLIPRFQTQVLKVEGARMMINFGLNRVRFPSPLPSGSRIRAYAVLQSADEQSGGSVETVIEVTIEREGGSQPACEAEVVTRYYPE